MDIGKNVSSPNIQVPPPYLYSNTPPRYFGPMTPSAPHRGLYHHPRFMGHRGRPFERGFRSSYNNFQTRSSYGDQNNRNVFHEFWCETCDRDFRNDEILKQHQSEHQTCGIDGCKYVAHPQVITKHIQMQHSSGLYNKIRSNNTPEEIEKWINERKSKYPSKENIEKQRQMNLEKIARGEKLGKESRGRGRGRGFGRGFPNNRSERGNFRSRGRGGREGTRRRRVFTIPDEILNSSKEDWNGELPPFPGTRAIYGEQSYSSDEEYSEDEMKDQFDDTEWMNKDNTKIKVEQVKINNALGALMAMYGSSDESDGKEQENAKNANESITCTKNAFKIDKFNITIQNEDKCISVSLEDKADDSGPEETAIVKCKENITTIIEQKQENATSSRKRKRKRNVTGDSQNKNESNTDTKIEPEVAVPTPGRIKKYRRYPTLLEKLLKNEIRHERNVLLQCVRYVVKNNFFGIDTGNKNIDNVENFINKSTKAKEKEKLASTANDLDSNRLEYISPLIMSDIECTHIEKHNIEIQLASTSN